MYSLTKATLQLVTSYEEGLKGGNKVIDQYNTHKLRHSNGVLELGRMIIILMEEKSKLDNELKNKAEIIFLLHDIARFHQNNKERILYNNEFNHGTEGYKYLKKLGYDNQICLATKYHNEYDIKGIYSEEEYIKMTSKEKKETIFLSELIRDADKIQNMIYEIFAIEGLIKLDPKLKDGDISDEILEDIKKGILVNRNSIKTKADHITYILGWIYDINFNESVTILKKFGYFEKIIKNIGTLKGVSKENLDKLNIIINKYLNERQ